MKFVSLVGLCLLLSESVLAAYSGTPQVPMKIDNCYQISSAEELYGFAKIMNEMDAGGQSKESVCAKLVADIVVNNNVLEGDSLNGDGSDFIPWTPIANFTGVFDGQNHTISGLYYKNTETFASAGFILTVTGTSEKDYSIVRNVGIVDSYFYGDLYVGGIVALARNLTLENVFHKGTVVGSTGVGGLVGLSSMNGTFLNSYNEGVVKGYERPNSIYPAMYIGGVAGYIHTGKNLVRNCYNIAQIDQSGSYVGGIVGIVGKETDLTIENSFNTVKLYNALLSGLVGYVDATANLTTNNSFNKGTNSGEFERTDASFSNGELAVMLHYGFKGEVWGQNVGTDPYPILSGFVKGYSGEVTLYDVKLHTFDGDTAEYVQQYLKGVGTTLQVPLRQNYLFGGWYSDSDFSGNAVTKILASDTGSKEFFAKWLKTLEKKDGCYEISSGEDLYVFAAIVNGNDGFTQERTACGRLTANIVVNKNVLDEKGNLNSAGSSTFKTWTPIGPFSGTFDGQGHYISGLYYNDSKKDQIGLFGYVSGSSENPGIIENVGLVDSYINSHDDAGTLIGKATGYVYVKNSYSTSTIKGGTFTGGLVGYENGHALTISNSYFAGNVAGYQCVGGMLGGSYGNEQVKFINSFNTKQGFVGYVKNKKDSSVIIVHSYAPSSSGYGETSVKLEQFKDGSVAAALHNYSSTDVDGSVWGQNVGVDLYPVLNVNFDAELFKVSKAAFHYNDDSITDEVMNYVEGVPEYIKNPSVQNKIFVGWYNNKSFDGSVVHPINAETKGDMEFYAKWISIREPETEDECYVIKTVDDLYSFAAIVNGANGMSKQERACAKQVADITVNKDFLKPDGTLKFSDDDLVVWTPIQNFRGTFDGQGHTINGLFYASSYVVGVGLFANLKGDVEGDGAVVKNVGIAQSYLKSSGQAGAIAGTVEGNVLLEGVFNSSIISAGLAGGLVGLVKQNGHLLVRNAFNIGSVRSGDDVSVGGLVGTINSGSFVRIVNSFNGMVLSNGNSNLINCNSDSLCKVEHSYYLSLDSVESVGSAATQLEFADGSIAKALREYDSDEIDGSMWGQNIGVDSYPNLTGEINISGAPVIPSYPGDAPESSSSETLESSSSENPESSPSDEVDPDSSSATDGLDFQLKKIPVVSIYTFKNEIFVDEFDGFVTVFDVNGKLLSKSYSNGSARIKVNRPGTYIVMAGKRMWKVLLKR